MVVAPAQVVRPAIAIQSVPSAGAVAARRPRWPWLVAGAVVATGIAAAIAVGTRGDNAAPVAAPPGPAPAVTIDAAPGTSRPAHVKPSKPASEVTP
jgi:hypothetical protein